MAGEPASGKTDSEDIKTKDRNGDMKDGEPIPKKMRQDDSDTPSDSSSSDSSSSDSSSSSDDDIPLLQATTTSSKQPPPPKKKKRPTDDDSNHPEKKRKKRRFIYSPIDPKDRCGKCKNCLNPHWKKPCIPARERQERRKEEGRGEIKEEEVQRHQEKKEVVQQQEKKEDPFRAALLTIVDELSCIQLSHLGDYISLCREEKELKNMAPLVNALYKSVITAADGSKRKELGRGFIQQGGLTPIEAWLPIFTKARKEKALLKLLTILEELPISVKEIKTPSTLGKSVTMVSKDEVVGEEIKKVARAIIVKWKALLKAGVTSETNTKKHAAADAAAIVTKNTTTLEDDVDLFKTADKHKIALSAAKSKSNTTTTNNNKVTSTTTTSLEQQQPTKPLKSQPSSAAASGGGGSTTTATTKPTTTPSSTSGGGGGGFSTYFGGATSILDTIAPLRKIAGSTAAEKAARAAAAVKDPDPLPKKKIKSKKVRWADDDGGGGGSKNRELASSRLFLMTDPAEAAKHDVDITKITALRSSGGGLGGSSGVGGGGNDTGSWASAKRKEHLNEASALALHRREEDREKGEIAHRMGRLHPQIQWYDPPLSEFITSLEQEKQDLEQGRVKPGDTDYKGDLLPGRGEDSEERHRLAALREREGGGGGGMGGGGGGDGGGVMLHPEEPSDPMMCGYSLDLSNMVEIRLEKMDEPDGEENGGGGGGGNNNTSAVQMPGINNLLAQLTASGVLEQQQREQQQQYVPPQPPTWQPRGLVLQKPLPAVPHGNAAPPPMLQQNRRRCTFWNSDKGCSSGVNCKFLHEGPGKFAQRGGGRGGGGGGGGGRGGRGSSFYTKPLVGLHGKK